MKTIFAFVLFAGLAVAHAATTHSVTLFWNASPDSTIANPGTVSIYRATGNCPVDGTIGALAYTALTTTAQPGGSYSDVNVTAGMTYCYYATFTLGGSTSVPSNTFPASVQVFAPSITQVLVK